MKYYGLIFGFALLCFSCENTMEKEIKTETLDISLKSVDSQLLMAVSYITVYPNPVQDVMNIYLPFSETATIYISKIDGVAMRFEIQDGNLIAIDMSNVSEGGYVVEIISNGVVFKENILKIN